MKFTVAALALAAGVSATYPHGNMTYTTEVVTEYETYCPGPTTISYGTATYTVTEPTTLTITDCPCTISKPVYTTSTVECSTCYPTETPSYPTSEYSTETPVYPTETPIYPTGTFTTSYPVYPTGTGVPTTTYPTSTPIPTGGAAKAAAAGMAGVVGLAAFFL